MRFRPRMSRVFLPILSFATRHVAQPRWVTSRKPAVHQPLACTMRARASIPGRTIAALRSRVPMTRLAPQIRREPAPPARRLGSFVALPTLLLPALAHPPAIVFALARRASRLAVRVSQAGPAHQLKVVERRGAEELGLPSSRSSCGIAVFLQS